MSNCPHCETPLDEHEANRCMDAWVETLRTGKRCEQYIDSVFQTHDWHTRDGNTWGRPVPTFTTDTTAAIGLLLGMDKKKYYWSLGNLCDPENIECGICSNAAPIPVVANAPSPEEAICRCYIAAREAEKGN